MNIKGMEQINNVFFLNSRVATVLFTVDRSIKNKQDWKGIWIKDQKKIIKSPNVLQEADALLENGFILNNEGVRELPLYTEHP